MQTPIPPKIPGSGNYSDLEVQLLQTIISDVVGGPNNSVQYNNDGVLAGSNLFTFDSNQGGSIYMRTADTIGVAGSINIQSGISSTGLGSNVLINGGTALNGPAGEVAIQGGQSNSGGGPVNILGGACPGIAATGDGGTVNIYGATVQSSGNGGAVTLTGGNNTGSGSPGSVDIAAGNTSTGTGNAAVVISGSGIGIGNSGGATGTAGMVYISGGQINDSSPNPPNTGTTGGVIITSGSLNGNATGNVGHINIITPSNTVGNAGNININAGGGSMGTAAGSVIITTNDGNPVGNLIFVVNGTTYYWPTIAPTNGQVLQASVSGSNVNLGWVSLPV
jgi:hypothetical protein